MYTTKPNYYKRDDVLNSISQEQVFSEYLGVYPDLNKRFRSPFREDKDPGCRFTWHSGILYFVENTMFNNKLYWSCIDIVMYFKKCSYQQALNILHQKIYVSSKIAKIVTSTFVPEIRFEKQDWHEPNLFMLPGSILEKELVYKVKNYWIKTKKGWFRNYIHNPQTTLVIAYYFPETDHVKLYFPEQKEYRWYSNCSVEDIFGWHKIKEYHRNSDKLSITKSGKDRLMLDYHLGIPAIALQNEGCYIPEDKVLELDVMFKDITFFYDNDIPGIIHSQKLSEKYGYKYKIIDCLPKDSFEMIGEFGIDNTKKLIF